MLRLSLALSGLVVLGAATSGCVVHGRARVGATAHVSTPAMVEVSPGVMVIEDYHEPVFYSDGYYWLYSDGIWLRSHYHTGGWARVRTVPHTVLRINRPHAYVRYRARGGARVYGRSSGRGHYRAAPHRHGPARRDVRERRDVRDHRGGGERRDDRGRKVKRRDQR